MLKGVSGSKGSCNFDIKKCCTNIFKCYCNFTVPEHNCKAFCWYCKRNILKGLWSSPSNPHKAWWMEKKKKFCTESNVQLWKGKIFVLLHTYTLYCKPRVSNRPWEDCRVRMYLCICTALRGDKFEMHECVFFCQLATLPIQGVMCLNIFAHAFMHVCVCVST